jgi:hypothetical protein
MGQLEEELAYSLRWALSEHPVGFEALLRGRLPANPAEAMEILAPTVLWAVDSLFRLAREIEETRGP